MSWPAAGGGGGTAWRRLAWRLRLLWFGLRQRLSHFGPAALTIAAISLVIFGVQQVAQRVMLAQGLTFNEAFTLLFGLHWPLFARGFIWQPLTYNFLHGSWLHLGLNLFTLLFFGSAVEYLLGRRTFWRFFLVSGIVGGLGWMAIDWVEPIFWQRLLTGGWQPVVTMAERWFEMQTAGRHGVCIGASAGVFGLVGAFAALCPQRKLVMLIFFVPVQMRARQVAILLMAITLVELVLSRAQVAYAAHLFGGLAGYLMARRHALKV